MIDNHETFEKFKYSLAPLIEEGKLACVLAQFPWGSSSIGRVSVTWNDSRKKCQASLWSTSSETTRG